MKSKAAAVYPDIPCSWLHACSVIYMTHTVALLWTFSVLR